MGGVIFFAALGVASWGIGLRVSFDTEGGAIGMVPVLSHAFMAPLCFTFALSVLRLLRPEVALPLWAVLVGFPLEVVLVGWTIALAGKRGEIAHRRRGH